MPKLRLASALLIPPPGRRPRSTGSGAACGDGMLGRVDAHVTLVEPINVREEALDEVEADHAGRRCGAPGPLTFTFGPARSFHPESPVLYLAVDGDLDELARAARCDAGRPVRSRGGMALRAARDDRDRPLRGATGRRRRRAGRLLDDGDAHATCSVLQEQRDADEVRRWRPIADAALGGRTVSGRGGIELEVTEAAGSGWTLTARHQGTVVGEARGWTTDGVLGSRGFRSPKTERGHRRRPAGCSPSVEDVARRSGATLLVASTVGVASELLARPRVARRG